MTDAMHKSRVSIWLLYISDFGQLQLARRSAMSLHERLDGVSISHLNIPLSGSCNRYGRRAFGNDITSYRIRKGLQTVQTMLGGKAMQVIYWTAKRRIISNSVYNSHPHTSDERPFCRIPTSCVQPVTTVKPTQAVTNIANQCACSTP